METRRILVLIAVSLQCAVVYAGCNDDTIHELNNLPERQPSEHSNFFNGGNDPLLSDDSFNFNWHKAVHNGWQYLMVDSNVLPNYTDCSTFHPVYLKETHPDVKTLTETTVVVTACERDSSGSERCKTSYDIGIRKCNGEIQYRLPGTDLHSAYCFKPYSELYGLTPDPSDAELGSVSVSPELHFTSQKRQYPWPETEYTPYFKIRCNFSSQEEYFYKVNWYVNGEFFISYGPSNDTDSLSVHEDEFENNSIPMGFDIYCGVSVLAAENGSETDMVYSEGYFVGIKVLNTTIYLEKDSTALLQMKSTMPIGCDYTISEHWNISDTCESDFMIFNYNVGAFNGQCGTVTGGVVNSVDILNQKCSKKYKTLREGDTWDPETLYNFTIITTDMNYDDARAFNLQLQFSHNMDHTIWKNYLFPTVKVIVVDNGEYKQKICYSHIDPHMRTSDGYYYEQQRENGQLVPGDYLMYRNKKYEIEVQESTKICNNDKATCACGIAIVSGQDIFMINRCGGINYLGFTRCDDGGILQVVKINDYKYNIFTPIGTKITVTLYKSGMYDGTMNIDITMAPKDLGNVEGLCGHFDNNMQNDLRHRNGNKTTPIHTNNNYEQRNHHDEFSQSWSLLLDDTREENVFLNANRNLSSWESQHGLYCICKNDSSRGKPEALCSKTQYINCSMANSITGTKCQVFNRKRRNVEASHKKEMYRLYTLMNEKEKLSRRRIHMRTKRDDEGNTISEQDANALCVDKINGSLAVTSYQEVGGNEDPDAVTSQCTFDVVVGNYTSWATAHVESLNNIVKNMIEQEPSYAKDNTEKVEIFMLNTCPGNCSNNGECTKTGECNCFEFYHGPDCLIDERDPLFIDDVQGGGECDLADGDECICFHVRSNDVLDGFKCRSNTSKINPDGLIETLTTLSFSGGYEDIFTGVCCIQNIIGNEHVFVAKYDISLSNNGIAYGNVESVYVFDSTCQSAEVSSDEGRTFTMKPAYCFIDGHCVVENEMAPDGCFGCQPTVATYNWTAYNPCRNGGICSDDVYGYSCSCAAGYEGINCAFEIDECSSSPCQNSGNCTDMLRAYSCYCPDGFAGNNCEINIDECALRPCTNNGICKDLVNAYTCDCQAGYEGIQCEAEINECIPEPCQNGGTCSDNVNGYTCACVAEFYGVNCSVDINDCESNPCQNGGACQDQVNARICTCSDGYEGLNCETNIDDCKLGPCLNGGSCIDLVNGYTCTCIAGFNDTNCSTNIDECTSNPCKHNASCVDGINKYKCICAAGYDGTHCENDIDDCSTNPCENSGLCQDGINQYTCTCAIGYEGVNCESGIDVCATNPCKNGGSCEDDFNQYTCTCVAGYDGIKCENDIDECLPNPCQHGGSCSNEVNEYTCTCASGFVGLNCENDVDECAGNPCENGGNCEDGINQYTCSCVVGYEGVNCQNDINECLCNPCMNGATCKDKVNEYTCICRTGFYGVNCQTDIDECASNPCQNYGSCSDRVNQYKCSCVSGYDGLTCENNINECLCNPCMNGATCKDKVNEYTCICRTGFYGVNCQTDINDCVSNPCLNGGICKDEVNGRICNCSTGYEGKDCETNINECLPNPCKNGGICNDGINGYMCSCAAGYTDTNCVTDINECLSDPCQNGGSCVNAKNMYTCSCAAGYTGTDCNTDINECSPNPCKNGGICTDGINEYTCICAVGFGGINCETDDTGPKSTEKPRSALVSRRIEIVFPFIHVVTDTIDLTDQTVRQDIQKGLIDFFQEILEDKLGVLTILAIRSGSIIVDFEIKYYNEENAAGDLTKGMTELVSGQAAIELMNETFSASSVTIDDLYVNNDTLNDKGAYCDVFIAINGPCANSSKCTVVDGSPSCMTTGSESGLTLVIVVVSCTIVVLVLTMTIVAVSVRAIRIRQKRLRHKGQYGKGISDDIDKWRRRP